MKKIFLFACFSMVAVFAVCSSGGGGGGGGGAGKGDDGSPSHKRLRPDELSVAAKPSQSSKFSSLNPIIRTMEQLLQCIKAGDSKKNGQFKRKFKTWIEENFIFDGSGKLLLLKPDPRPGTERANSIRDIKSVILLLKEYGKMDFNLRALSYRKSFQSWHDSLQGLLKSLGNVFDSGASENIARFLPINDRRAVSLTCKKGNVDYQRSDKFEVAARQIGNYKLSLSTHGQPEVAQSDIQSVAILDGVNIAVGTGCGKIVFADVDNGWTDRFLNEGSPVKAISSISPQRLLIGLEDARLKIFNLATNAYEISGFIQNHPRHNVSVNFALAYSDRDFLGFSNQNFITQLYKTSDLAPFMKRVYDPIVNDSGSTDAIFDVAVKRGEYVAIAHQSGSIVICKKHEHHFGFVKNRVTSSAVTALDIVDNHIIFGTQLGEICVCEYKNGGLNTTIKQRISLSSYGAVYHISDFKDDEIIASFKNGLVVIINIKTGEKNIILDAVNDFENSDSDDVYKAIVLRDKRILVFNESNPSGDSYLIITAKYLKQKFLDANEKFKQLPREEYKFREVDIFDVLHPSIQHLGETYLTADTLLKRFRNKTMKPIDRFIDDDDYDAPEMTIS